MADLVRSLPAPQREYVVWQDPDKSLRKTPTPKSRARVALRLGLDETGLEGLGRAGS